MCATAASSAASLGLPLVPHREKCGGQKQKRLAVSGRDSEPQDDSFPLGSNLERGECACEGAFFCGGDAALAMVHVVPFV